MPNEESSRARSAGTGPGPLEVRKITDARTLRALTHPVRIALIEELVHGGAMTATQVGERIGETPTTCSFHLRQLAKYGFVEEAGGGRGRARPWRLTSIGWSFTAGGDPEAEIAGDALLRLYRERQFARYDRWRQTQASYPAAWRDAADDSAYMFYLTAAELEQLSTEVEAVLMRWFRFEGRLEDPSKRPPGAVPVETLLLSYPTARPAPDDGEGPAPGAEG